MVSGCVCWTAWWPTTTKASDDNLLTDHSFYHLQRQSIEAALPKLLERVYGAGLRAVVRAGSDEQVQNLNKLLWTYDPGSFLPHGAKTGSSSADQPIHLTSGDENPNQAKVLLLLDGTETGAAEGYERCLYLFDGNDPEALAAARERWKWCRDQGASATYYQQSPEGWWEEKAASA